MTMILILLMCILATTLFAEVTILPFINNQWYSQTIYSHTTKLRICGSFDANERSVILHLAATGMPSLRVDKDFTITIDDVGIMLTLVNGRKWVDLTGRYPPVGLILSSVRYASNPDINHLPKPMVVAHVIPTPTVNAANNIIYVSETSELCINGTGLMFAKKLDIYFLPPLFDTFEVMSKFPLSSDIVVLRIRYGHKWREEPGPLMVIGVDTGGGPTRVGGDDGVIVATVQADPVLDVMV